MASEPPPGISLWPVGDSLTRLEAQVQGPGGTVYEAGVFKLSVTLPARWARGVQHARGRPPSLAVAHAACSPFGWGKGEGRRTAPSSSSSTSAYQSRLTRNSVTVWCFVVTPLGAFLPPPPLPRWAHTFCVCLCAGVLAPSCTPSARRYAISSAAHTLGP